MNRAMKYSEKLQNRLDELNARIHELRGLKEEIEDDDVLKQIKLRIDKLKSRKDELQLLVTEIEGEPLSSD